MIIIPARLASTRLARKVLREIEGVPMLILTARNVAQADEVVVAYDDDEIGAVCEKYHIQCIKTSPNHTSGTDRCAEASEKLNLADSEIVINVQADEPFLESSLILTLKNLILHSNAFMASLAKVITPAEAADSNLVKVILNAQNEAIYFSRYAIPFLRDNAGVPSDLPHNTRYLGHLGIYGFSVKTLREFCALPKSPLEDIEKLEQLRALYHRKSIAMAVVETKSYGIDTIEDYEKALQKAHSSK